MHSGLIRSPGVFLVALVLAVLTMGDAQAAFKTWTKSRGATRMTLDAELVAFDFKSKAIRCRDRQGEEHYLATADLDPGSQFQLLLSPEFLRSYPEDEFSSEQRHFILLAIAVPAVFLLVSFFFSALLLTRSFNPLRALIGWGGSVVLGAFLVSVYVFLSVRSPDSATGIAVFGTIVVTGLLSLYVSIVYRTSVIKGLKLLLFHVFGAIFLFAITLLVLKLTMDSQRWAEFLERNLYHPTGLV